MKLPTEEKMREILEKYWKECKEAEWLPTKNGMTLALDICKKTYTRWVKKSPTLKEFEKLCEESWVQLLQKQSVAGIIFYLKNAFGYRDSRDLEIGGNVFIKFDPIFKDESNNASFKTKRSNSK